MCMSLSLYVCVLVNVCVNVYACVSSGKLCACTLSILAFGFLSKLRISHMQPGTPAPSRRTIAISVDWRTPLFAWHLSRLSWHGTLLRSLLMSGIMSASFAKCRHNWYPREDVKLYTMCVSGYESKLKLFLLILIIYLVKHGLYLDSLIDRYVELLIYSQVSSLQVD